MRRTRYRGEQMEGRDGTSSRPERERVEKRRPQDGTMPLTRPTRTKVWRRASMTSGAFSRPSASVRSG